MESYDLRELNAAKAYGQLADIWDAHCSGQVEEILSEWDYFFLMQGLYKAKRFKDCLLLYKECKGLYPDATRLQDKMGWAVYHVHLRGHDFENGDNRKYIQMVDYVLSRCEEGQYSPCQLIVKQVTDAILHSRLGVNPDYRLVAHYLSLIHPANCSDEEQVFTDSAGESRHMASEREGWYGKMTKVQLQLKQYEECLATCQEALASVTKFHNGMDCWLHYRMAHALRGLGRPVEALAELKQALALGIRNWAVYALGWRLSADLGEGAQAACFAAQAALCDNSHDKRVSFYLLLAEALYQAGEVQAAALHRQLVHCLRQENGWKEKGEFAWEQPAEVAALDGCQVLGELRKLWQSWLENGRPRQQGSVRKIIADGRAGFIDSDEGGSYYFRFGDVVQGRRELAEGSRVEFALEERLDRAKQEIKQNAVAVKLLREA